MKNCLTYNITSNFIVSNFHPKVSRMILCFHLNQMLITSLEMYRFLLSLLVIIGINQICFSIFSDDDISFILASLYLNNNE